MAMNIIEQYQTSFRNNFNEIALCDYFTKKSYTYGELAEHIAQIHVLFDSLKIEKGDKIALVGRNTSAWVISYMSIITYGAVVVPILSDFNPADMKNIIDHSDSKLLFIDRVLWRELSDFNFSNLIGALDLEKTEFLYGTSILLMSIDSLKRNFADRYNSGFSAEDISYPVLKDDDTMIISYTSGTTGLSKGVMLTVDNITSNVNFALDHKFHFNGSRVLGLLPLAHAYGCAFDMLTPLSVGSKITLLGKTPSPAILLNALKEIRPHLICTVPLVMEKVVRKNVLPALNKPIIKRLLCIPIINSFIYHLIKVKMLKSFGGSIKEVNIGGAALSDDVEKFLRKIKFPFTIGYGMTECAPLISYEVWNKTKPGSCGRVLPNMMAKCDSCDDRQEAGEICVRGSNVMKGYYKDPESTSAAIDSQGWLHTGDIGTIDDDGFIFLKGRCKSMILTANGQNIYPESIEIKLNSLPYVMESLVYDENGKLIALVVPDKDSINKDGANIQSIMTDNLNKLNSLVSSFEKISEIKLCSEEFEKTPKRSIRRYLYPAAAKLLVI